MRQPPRMSPRPIPEQCEVEHLCRPGHRERSAQNIDIDRIILLSVCRCIQNYRISSENRNAVVRTEIYLWLHFRDKSRVA